MSDKYSVCCGAPPAEYFGVCSKCLDHTGFEELCSKCEDPCLLDGKPIDDIPVIYTEDGGFETVMHSVCPA